MLRTYPGVPGPARSTPSDDTLVRRAALGDRDAFADLVVHHGPALYRYAIRMLGDAAEAEDVVQDTFVRAWVGLERFRGESRIQTWLFRILTNRVRQLRRAAQPIPVDDAALSRRPATSHSDPEQNLLDHELLDAVDAALARLPEMQRAVWLLREVEGLTYDEIATVLSTSRTVVRGQLHRARCTLEERLAGWK